MVGLSTARRYPGLSAGVIGGTFAGSALVFGALYQHLPVYGLEFFGILLPLALFGLLYDLRLGEVGNDIRGWKITAGYWTITFPVARLLHDLGTLGGAAITGQRGAPIDLLPHLASLDQFLAWWLYQAVFGTAYGMVFIIFRNQVRRTGGD